MKQSIATIMFLVAFVTTAVSACYSSSGSDDDSPDSSSGSGWHPGCPNIQLQPGENKLPTMSGDVKYNSKSVYVTIFGFDIGGIYSACPKIDQSIVGGSTSVNLGSYGDTTFNSNGQGSSSLITAATFTTGDNDDFQIVVACVIGIAKTVVMYQKVGSTAAIDGALSALKAHGLDVVGDKWTPVCNSS